MIREVMQEANLVVWPMITLVLFFVSMLVMLLWVWRKGSEEVYEDLSQLVLEEDNYVSEKR